ncbi:MAG: PGF-pre-PGF domain-containing protein [Candidatus Pacearchaeota archaeon]
MNNSKLFLVGVMISLFVIVALVPSLNAISSSDINQFLQESVTNLTVTIHQNDAQANLYLNTKGTSFDRQIITSNNINITDLLNKLGETSLCNKLPFNCTNFSLTFNISDVLNGVNWSIGITKGSNITQLSNLSTSENVPLEMISSGWPDIRSINFSNITTITEINNYLAAHSLNYTFDRNITFTKQGTDYILWNSDGYGDLGSATKDNIRKIISDDVESMTIQQIVDKAIPVLNNLSNGSGDTLNSLLNGTNLNFIVTAVDLSKVNLEDGNYVVPITISDGTNAYTKKIYLVLQGIKNIGTDNSTGGVYESSNPEIQNYLNNIIGFNDGAVTVSLFDDGSNYPSISGTVIKYLDFTFTQGITGSAIINFKIPNYKNIDPTRIVLYHFDGTNWNQLSTHYNGLDSSKNYLFDATTTSFSPFAIVETVAPIAIAPAIGNNGGVYGGTFVTAPIATTPAVTTPTANTPTTPTATGFNFFRALGAVVGAPNSTGTGIVVFIVVIFIVGGVITVFVMNRKPSKKKAEKDEE